MLGAIVRIAQPQVIGASFFVKHIISYSYAWGKKKVTQIQGASGKPRGCTYGGEGFLGGQKELGRLLE
jgi:hypothetical protein